MIIAGERTSAVSQPRISRITPRSQVSARPHIERNNYQQANFLTPWPWPGTQGKSFALNSNHDMYAHGTGYFNTALASPIFASQNRCSYFALYNDRFRIVGLDTAYFDPDQSGSGFMI